MIDIKSSRFAYVVQGIQGAQRTFLALGGDADIVAAAVWIPNTKVADLRACCSHNDSSAYLHIHASATAVAILHLSGCQYAICLLPTVLTTNDHWDELAKCATMYHGGITEIAALGLRAAAWQSIGGCKSRQLGVQGN
jgi:hypothetical protein